MAQKSSTIAPRPRQSPRMRMGRSFSVSTPTPTMDLADSCCILTANWRRPIPREVLDGTTRRESSRRQWSRGMPVRRLICFSRSTTTMREPATVTVSTGSHCLIRPQPRLILIAQLPVYSKCGKCCPQWAQRRIPDIFPTPIRTPAANGASTVQPLI